MIFIWTSEAGPLQYIGPALFFIQLLPQFVFLVSQQQVPAVHWTLMIGVSAVVLPVTVGVVLHSRRAGGSLDQLSVSSQLLMDSARRSFQAIHNDPAYLFVVAATVLAVAAVILLGDIRWLSLLLHVVPLVLMLRTLIGRHTQAASQQAEVQSHQAKLSQIVRVIQKMPIEEFIAEDYEKCTVSQLKHMLKVRGKPIDIAERRCLERHELEESVQECRTFCDSCCICCDDYQPGDPLRILPNCRHEFHRECLDQWAYTFANKNKRQRDPTCPLCNVTL